MPRQSIYTADDAKRNFSNKHSWDNYIETKYEQF